MVKERSRKYILIQILKIKKLYDLDIFEGVKSDFMYTAQYDENSDIGTNYLWKPKMERQDEFKAELKPSIPEDCYISGKLLYGTDCKTLLGMGVSMSFMSKFFI